MDNAVKQFIEDNIELIEQNEWEEVYKRADTKLIYNRYIGQFSKTLLDADIHPEYYLSRLPDGFLNRTSVTSFTIPDNIKSIDKNVFFDCESLTNVIISKSVTSIGEYAFYGCTGLTSIVIPDNVTIIDDYAFADCMRLTNVTIEEGVKSIYSSAFYNCEALTIVTMPNSVESINEDAFSYCSDKVVINYNGTKAEWKQIYNSKAFTSTYFTVNCTDGKIVKKKR